MASNNITGVNVKRGLFQALRADVALPSAGLPFHPTEIPLNPTKLALERTNLVQTSPKHALYRPEVLLNATSHAYDYMEASWVRTNVLLLQ